MNEVKAHGDLLLKRASEILWSGYRGYFEAFKDLTQRAGQRFEQGDAKGMRHDTVERLDLYEKSIDLTRQQLTAYLGRAVDDRDLWHALKTRFSQKLRQRCDAELACTYYNSINRRIFQSSGIEARLVFIEPPCRPSVQIDDSTPSFSLETAQVTSETIDAILTQFDFKTSFSDIETDCRLCAERFAMLNKHASDQNERLRIEMLRMPFYRHMTAYLIGRIGHKAPYTPLVFALRNEHGGLFIDALLQTTEQLRILFSFTRAYFHVETNCPAALVRFLNELMPHKRIAELYIGLGFHKHGKTELYRELLRHQSVCSQDRFEPAVGQQGMVMLAFYMSQDDLIYKVIRDRFAAPKKTTRQQVMEKYDYVFKHDRAGRLVDVQTFENLRLDQCCITETLLAEFQNEARRMISISDGQVILHHVYVERRVTPLDVFLQSADWHDAKAAVVDYGQTIKDLAYINVFPGDMLIKNFGVTRLGRVVFYDYDELCPLTDCNFRRLPQARQYDQALEAEPWFMVDENDVFPEEFVSFLGLAPALREVFLKHHADLLSPGFWRQAQRMILSGKIKTIVPYSQAQRLRSKIKI